MTFTSSHIYNLFLCSSASKPISDLKMTWENYTQAKNLLNECYGNSGGQIGVHVKEFVAPAKTMNDVSGLRNLLTSWHVVLKIWKV